MCHPKADHIFEYYEHIVCKHRYVIVTVSQGDVGFRGLPGQPGPPGEGLQGPPVRHQTQSDSYEVLS